MYLFQAISQVVRPILWVLTDFVVFKSFSWIPHNRPTGAIAWVSPDSMLHCLEDPTPSLILIKSNVVEPL